jgi:hypothetical protein
LLFSVYATKHSLFILSFLIFSYLNRKPWFVNHAQAGYSEQYSFITGASGDGMTYRSSLTFATVKGAGHEVPQYQPRTSGEMVRRFIATQSVDAPVNATNEVTSGRRNDAMQVTEVQGHAATVAAAKKAGRAWRRRQQSHARKTRRRRKGN